MLQASDINVADVENKTEVFVVHMSMSTSGWHVHSVLGLLWLWRVYSWSDPASGNPGVQQQ